MPLSTASITTHMGLFRALLRNASYTLWSRETSSPSVLFILYIAVYNTQICIIWAEPIMCIHNTREYMLCEVTLHSIA